jgi:hypothetical protein
MEIKRSTVCAVREPSPGGRRRGLSSSFVEAFRARFFCAPIGARSSFCRFRKLCGVRSGNSAVSGVILIVIEAGVTSEVLGAERGTIEA